MKSQTDIAEMLRAAGIRGDIAEAAATAALKQRRVEPQSRVFTPRTDRRIKREIDRVPPTLDAKLRAKCAREGVSLRHLTLSLWSAWLELEADA
jgi:hypothetical protein